MLYYPANKTGALKTLLIYCEQFLTHVELHIVHVLLLVMRNICTQTHVQVYALAIFLVLAPKVPRTIPHVILIFLK